MATYTDEIEIPYETYGKDVNLQCQDDAGDGVDVSGCTVKWKIITPYTDTAVRNLTCTEVDLTVGKIKYTLLAADWGSGKLEEGEHYKSQLIATKADYQEKFLGLKVEIEP